jgi:catechol 2,3-dioxygenase-like lactoylglutathione lyase family enzyme
MTGIRSFVWGVRDIPRAVDFWTQALNYRLREEPSDDWANLVPVDAAGPRFSLMLVSSDAPRRHHVDLDAEDMEAEADRMVAIGATRVADWKYEPDDNFIVLADPDGNTFCVVQS